MQPWAVSLVERMKKETYGEAANSLGVAFARLEPTANSNMLLRDRIQQYIELLKLPLVVGEGRKALLSSLEKLTHEKFDGNIWRFVDWASQSPEGQSLHLDLRSRGGR